MPNILLVDLSSLAHPLFHVSASDPDPNATSTKTVERVRALASGQPHVAICAEGGRSFRKDVDPTYKATRPEHDAALQHQIALALDILKADGFPVWSVKGFEADDVIATSVNRALQRQDVRVTIATADKDLSYLVSDRVTVKSLTNGALYGPDDIKVKFGVPPYQMLDYLALVGDNADNIKGANGIGPKTAATLLSKYGTIENLYKELTQHGTQFTASQATNLREFQPRLPIVRELLALRTDVPIPFDEIWKPRIPADVEVFGDEDDPMMADIREAMPTLMDVQEAAMAAGPATALPASGDIKFRADAFAVATVGLMDASPPIGGTAAVSPARQMPPPARQEAPSVANNGGDEAKSAKAPTPVLAPAALVVREPALVDYEHQLEPQNIQEAKTLSADLFASRLFSSYGHPAGVLSTILAGRELGMSAMASLRGFHIIDGKPTLSADLIRALVLRSGKAEYFRCTERTPDRATFITKRKGDPECSLTFTVAEAKIAWSKGDRAWEQSGWSRNSADMCVARASAKLARLVYSDIVFNIYSDAEFD